MKISDHPQLFGIGHMAVFYLPKPKLDCVRYSVRNMTPRSLLHQFVLEHFNAYTAQDSNIQGYWRPSRDGSIFHDINERFEVSFDGEYRVPLFIDFLAALCYLIEEECLYLTMGYRSWLVFPKQSSSSDIERLLKLNS